MPRIHTKWSFSSLVVVLALGVTSSSRADPTPADVESAKASFSQGMNLRAQNDLQGALVRFRAAYALVPTPITGVEVGRTLVDLGHVLEGRALLLEVAQMPKKAGESDRAQEARDEASDLAEKAKARLATLTIDARLEPESVVTIDEAAIPKDAALAPRVLDPGRHVVVLRTGSRAGRAEVDLAAGQQHTVHVEMTETGPAPVGKLAFHPGVPFYVSVVIAGASALVGVATGIPALTTASSLSGACPGRVCPPSEASTLNTSLALGWISTVSFAVFGVATVSSIIAFAVSGRRESPKAALRFVPGLGSLSLVGSFR
jgi:hypothetical protein